jgi:hypothetical protein
MTQKVEDGVEDIIMNIFIYLFTDPLLKLIDVDMNFKVNIKLT